jgi:hypothetical protein
VQLFISVLVLLECYSYFHIPDMIKTFIWCTMLHHPMALYVCVTLHSANIQYYVVRTRERYCTTLPEPRALCRTIQTLYSAVSLLCGRGLPCEPKPLYGTVQSTQPIRVLLMGHYDD